MMTVSREIDSCDTKQRCTKGLNIVELKQLNDSTFNVNKKIKPNVLKVHYLLKSVRYHLKSRPKSPID